MTDWINHPVALALASALLHFVWQGAVLALLALASWRSFRSAHARYVAGVVTLAAMLAAPIVTTVHGVVGYAIASQNQALEVSQDEPVSERSDAPGAPTDVIPAAAEDTFAVPPGEGPSFLGNLLANWRAIVLLFWAVGVLVLSGRLLGGWLVARRLTRRGVSPVRREVAALAARVAGRLSLDRTVRIVESTTVSVPVMVGWLKPVVVIPASAVTSLAPVQVEALLAHEFAHVRRHDYFVNLLQSVVETLLFYHPAVWWVSRQVRTERERCCDDLAVTVCDRLTYVTALTDLAALHPRPNVALGATDGSLLDRVRRLLGHPHAEEPTGGAWIPALLLVLSATAVLPGLAAAPLMTQPAAGSALSTALPDGTSGEVPGSAENGAPTAPGTASTAVSVGNEARTVEPESRAANARAAAQTERRERRAQTRTEDQQARLAELSELLAKEQALAARHLAEKSENELRQLELELKAAETELASASLQKRLELEALRRDLEQARARVEVGLVDPAEVQRLTDALRIAEAQLASLQAEGEARREQAKLRVEAATRQHEFEQRQLEIEHARRRLELEHALAGAADLRRELAETVFADQSQPIASGDVLVIDIAGESALPRLYTVAPDGTIVLPLLGRIDAAGRTSDQVRARLRELLIERGLKENPIVTVTRRTPRR